jgi:hypothetical protein
MLASAALRYRPVPDPGAAPVQRVGGEAKEHLAGEGVVPRMQRRKLAHEAEDLCAARQPAEQDLAGGFCVFRGGPFLGSHTPTVGQNH